MHLQPRRLPIGDILAIGWKLLQFSRGSEQCCRGDLTDDKYIEQTIVNACTGSDLHASASLTPVADNCHRPASSNFTTQQPQPSLIMMEIDRQNCTHHGVSSGTKQALEFR